MSGARLRRVLLWLAATDATFERGTAAGGEALVGRCIHCGSRLAIGIDGEPLSDASVEHLVPLSHGGPDSLDNCAIACRRCNNDKGVRIDSLRPSDPHAIEVIARLLARKAERRREPLAGLSLPPLERPRRGDDSNETDPPRRPVRGRRKAPKGRRGE